jgi:PhnB protein
MTSKHVPNNLRTVTPYLTVKGADALLVFLSRTFGAEEVECHRDAGAIVHAKVRIDDSVIELSEATAQWSAMPCALHVYVPDCDAVHARAVAAGATVLHEPMDQPYGERSSAVRDPVGNNWYIATYTGERADRR